MLVSEICKLAERGRTNLEILDEKEEYVYAPRGLLLVYEMRKRAGFLREKKISKEEKMRIMEKEVWSVSTDKSRTIIVSVC